MATQNANTDAKFIKFHSRKFIKCLSEKVNSARKLKFHTED